jgi:hypothetical protein
MLAAGGGRSDGPPGGRGELSTPHRAALGADLVTPLVDASRARDPQVDELAATEPREERGDDQGAVDEPCRGARDDGEEPRDLGPAEAAWPAERHHGSPDGFRRVLPDNAHSNRELEQPADGCEPREDRRRGWLAAVLRERVGEVMDVQRRRRGWIRHTAQEAAYGPPVRLDRPAASRSRCPLLEKRRDDRGPEPFVKAAPLPVARKEERLFHK